MDKPLVTVCVITYNSSKFVLETLDSIKAQTYDNIELIISDDYSSDNTVDICREWLSKHKDSFVSVKLITSDKNTGIAPNANRGWYQARGEWVKGIDGDDKLLPNCIRDDISYVTDHPETDILFTKQICFGSIADKISDPGLYFRNLSKEEFDIILRCRNFIPSATEFIKRSCFLELGGWNESFPFIEDWPFWIKALEHKKIMSFLNKVTVCYRFSENSISQKHSKSKPSKKYIDSVQKALKIIHAPLLQRCRGSKYYFWSHQIKLEGTIKGRILHKTNIFNPFYYKCEKILRKCR
ncbi:MAG: glycosyltransferase [Prevotella sp.]|jgi:alpha-1,3-rhamnosyltransferase|nr:glycosyltransferase [Prevotella sp.]